MQFDVALLPATVTRLNILVPAGYSIQTSAGDVTSEPAEGSNVRYTLHLGSQTRCRLLVQRDHPDERVGPQVFVESDVTHVVRRDGLQVQARFSIEVVRRPVSRFSFLLPDELDVYSATWGSDVQLEW